MVPSSSVANGLHGPAASAAVTPRGSHSRRTSRRLRVVARTARVCFSRVNVVVDGISAKPVGRSDVGLDPGRIVDSPAQHLESATDADHRVPEPCCVEIQSARPTRRSQMQIGDRVLAARQDDEVVLGGRTAPSIQSAQVSSRKSVAFDRCGNLTIAVRAPAGGGVCASSLQREAVFGVEMNVRRVTETRRSTAPRSALPASARRRRRASRHHETC